MGLLESVVTAAGPLYDREMNIRSMVMGIPIRQRLITKGMLMSFQATPRPPPPGRPRFAGNVIDCSSTSSRIADGGSRRCRLAGGLTCPPQLLG